MQNLILLIDSNRHLAFDFACVRIDSFVQKYHSNCNQEQNFLNIRNEEITFLSFYVSSRQFNKHLSIIFHCIEDKR